MKIITHGRRSHLNSSWWGLSHFQWYKCRQIGAFRRLQTKGLRPQISTFVPRAFGPGYKCTFEIRGILELNQTKSENGRFQALPILPIESNLAMPLKTRVGVIFELNVKSSRTDFPRSIRAYHCETYLVDVGKCMLQYCLFID